MKSVVGDQKTKGLYKQIYEERKKARRREKYLSCFAVFVFVFCLVLVAIVIGLIVVGIVELI